ncbi:MAG: YciI family protein [Pseudomonadota bacterium]
MRYMIIIQEHEKDFEKRDDPEAGPAYWQSWQTFSDIVREVDPDFSGAALYPPGTATTVRPNCIEDGPLADTREQLGGFFIVNVDHLDIALEIAAKCPAFTNGAIEVRPVLPMEG